jgi:hypothetical protein
MRCVREPLRRVEDCGGMRAQEFGGNIRRWSGGEAGLREIVRSAKMEESFPNVTRGGRGNR